eukprot:scaffold358384_cov45-Prasinocladus_malaysianus.AAC.2
MNSNTRCRWSERQWGAAFQPMSCNDQGVIQLSTLKTSTPAWRALSDPTSMLRSAFSASLNGNSWFEVLQIQKSTTALHQTLKTFDRS